MSHRTILTPCPEQAQMSGHCFADWGDPPGFPVTMYPWLSLPLFLRLEVRFEQEWKCGERGYGLSLVSRLRSQLTMNWICLKFELHATPPPSRSPPPSRIPDRKSTRLNSS